MEGTEGLEGDRSPADGTRSAREVSATVARPGEFAPLRLGPLEVWPPVVLAPMAGVTNYPFRSLCREFGAGLYVSEMITARGYLEGHKLTRLLASAPADERPRSIQVYSANPRDAGEMVRRLVDEGLDHVDLNLGCPVPKVTRHGGGSAIPVKPRLMASIVGAMVEAAQGVPVTVKVRKGIDDDLLTFLDAGRVAEEVGASAIGLHARTAAELYSGKADWTAIAELKRSVRIPVLGNGDIWEAGDALCMMRETGCDGVIVGRGCLGRPWLFRELAQAFEGESPGEPPDLGGVARVLADHADRMVAFFGEALAMRQLRKWVGWYTKGFRGSASLRAGLNGLHTRADLDRLLAGLDPSEPFPRHALRVSRAKGSRRQKVTLPHGYLDDREDATPPDERGADLESALQAG